MGDIVFTNQITISGRTVSIASTTGSVLTSDRSFSASSGGMLLIIENSTVNISGLHFVSGSAASNGGCLSGSDSNLAVVDSSFTNCTADNDGGGAYWLRTDVAFTNTTFTDCSASNSGGGVAIEDSDGVAIYVTKMRES